MVKTKLLALTGIALFFALPTSLFAQDANLVKAAKKGGKVMVYGSIENDTIDLIAAAFKRPVWISTSGARQPPKSWTGRQ
jgi:hypothetical protein